MTIVNCPVAWLEEHQDGRRRIYIEGGIYDQDAGWGHARTPLNDIFDVVRAASMPSMNHPDYHCAMDDTEMLRTFDQWLEKKDPEEWTEAQRELAWTAWQGAFEACGK